MSLCEQFYILNHIKMVETAEALEARNEESELIGATREELSDLSLSVWPDKDREKFDKLSTDSTLKKWLDKIVKKETKSMIDTFEKQYYESLDRNWVGYLNGKLVYPHERSVEAVTRLVVRQHPDLISFVCWDLWLPYEKIAIRNTKMTNFSQLTFEQKMSFMSLYNTIRFYGGQISKISSRDFINQYYTQYNAYFKIVADNFNRIIEPRKILWYADVENVVKNTYWLTSAEWKKFKEYIEIIQKHPEYVWWDKEIKVQEAGAGWWWFVAGFLSAVVLALGYMSFKNIFRLQEPETRIYWKTTEIKNFSEVFKVLSLQAEASSNRREFEADAYGYFDEDTWAWIARAWKWFANRWIEAANLVQGRKLDLEVNTELAYLFDFKSAKCNVEVKNWKWIFHVKVKRPEIKVINVDAKIYKSKREWINMDKFDDFELEAVDTLKQEAIDKAKQPANIKKASDSLKNNILGIFKTTWFANSNMVVKAEDVQDVIIEYEN